MLSISFSACNSVLVNVLVSSIKPIASRGLAVLSWGRNVEGQCGLESSLLVLRPTPVIELHDAAVTELVAGKLHSGAITAHGEAWTWGDGKGGKLGHGSADHVHAPHRVESLVGRAAVRQVALGDSHTLFVDGSGGLWACGENKEGQCGLGTPLEVIAAQHRRAYYETFRALREAVAGEAGRGTGREEPRVSREQRARQAIHSLLRAPGSGSAAAAQHSHSSYGHGGGSGGSGAGHHWGSDRVSGWKALAAAGTGGGSGGDAAAGSAGGVSSAGARSALNFSGLDFEGAFAASGIQPGQQATPLRIGRDQHPLWTAVTAAGGGGGAATHGRGDEPGMRLVLPSGLESEAVVGVAAGKFFSAALTAAGEVWTFGACYNGSLGSNSSWSTSAQKVSGCLAGVLEDAGGATRVVAGGSFCAALTASGRVVVWGRLPGSEDGADAGAGTASGGGDAALALGLTQQGVGAVQGGRLLAGVVPGLPPITYIAAGLQHLLLSDGHRVWVIGRTLDAAGAVACTAPWRRPSLALTMPDGDDAVQQLVAGAHSSGVVSERGHAWVWGRLMDRHHADSVARRHPNLAYDSDVVGGSGAWPAAPPPPPLSKDDVRWEWAGFGSQAPTRVDGLGGRVKALALGGWHAMAAVE